MKKSLFVFMLFITSLNYEVIAGSYNRDSFGGWKDFDRDCQNQRHELLISLSTVPVVFTDHKKCNVKQGRWISPYTNKVIFNAKEIDIDHIVPLKWAWNAGANNWSNEKKIKFYNDPINIIPVEKQLNRQKGSKDISDWLPPENKCGYISRYVRIIKIYQLKLSSKKTHDFQSLMRNCIENSAL